VGPEIIVIALIYIQRILSTIHHFQLTHENAKGVLLASLCLASKFYHDKFEKHTIFSLVGGISKK
jgi:hypothetical protein